MKRVFHTLLLLLVALTATAAEKAGSKNLRQVKTATIDDDVEVYDLDLAGQEQDDAGTIKAGLVLSVGLVANDLRENSTTNFGIGAPVFLAAVLQSLCRWILRLALGHVILVRAERVNPLITSREINLSVTQDKDLAALKNAKKRKKHARRSSELYSSSIYKVMKELVNDDAEISKKGMAIMDSFMNDMVEIIATEAGTFAMYNEEEETLTEREIEDAVIAIFPEDLQENAVDAGKKAMAMFFSE